MGDYQGAHPLIQFGVDDCESIASTIESLHSEDEDENHNSKITVNENTCPCGKTMVKNSREIQLELENKKLKEELFAARLALVDQNNVIVELKNMLTISKKQIAKNVKSFSERKLEYEREIKKIKSTQEGDA